MRFAPQWHAIGPTVRPSGAAKHGKHIVNCDFSTFSCACIFFLLTLSVLWLSLFSSLLFSSLALPPSAFHLSILSEVWLLNFLWQKGNGGGCGKWEVLSRSCTGSQPGDGRVRFPAGLQTVRLSSKGFTADMVRWVWRWRWSNHKLTFDIARSRYTKVLGIIWTR